jgi:hypothetical protein
LVWEIKIKKLRAGIHRLKSSVYFKSSHHFVNLKMGKTKILSIITFLAISTVTSAQNNLMSNRNKYKGIVLGDTVTSILSLGLVPLEKDGKKDKDGELHYRLTSSAFSKIGDNVKINETIVTVFGGHVLSVSIFFDRQYGQDIRDVFEKAYGDYVKPNEFSNVYYWLGAKTDVSLDYDQTTSSPHALFVSDYIDALQKVYKRDSAEKATSDL